MDDNFVNSYGRLQDGFVKECLKYSLKKYQGLDEADWDDQL